MRKIAVLLMLAAMLFSTAAAFAGETTSSTSGKSGWQSVYDSIASWSWSKSK